MGTVNPIKDRRILDRMKEHLREESTRNYLLFRLGINLGIPMNELLQLRIEDIVGKREFLFGNYRIRISESLQKDIAFYTGERKEGYLFRSSLGKPLSRFQLYNILKSTAERVGYQELVGALTLRKTFAYWAYKENRIYLPLLSKYLNHHTVSYTLKYMDMEKEKEEICLAEMDL